jgi:hypothetical protein
VHADFPAAFGALQGLLQQVEGADSTRSALATGGAVRVAALKGSLVRAEDARLLGAAAGMLRHYKRLMDCNRCE